MAALGSFAGGVGAGDAGNAVGMLSNAAKKLTGQFEAMAGPMKEFVGAFNPAAVAVFNQAMRDLNAVIGSALLPVFNAVTSATRSFADVLLPVVRELAPTMQQLADAVGNILAAQVRAAAGAMEAMVPLIEIVVGLFDAMAPLMDAVSSLFRAFFAVLRPIFDLVNVVLKPVFDIIKRLSGIIADAARLFEVLSSVIGAVIEAFVDFLSDALGGPSKQINDALDGLRKAFQELAKATVVLTGAFFKLIGFDRGLEALIRAVEGPKRQSSFGIAAASQSSLQDIAELGKSVAQGAFIATAAGGGAKKTEDYMKDILGELKGMRDADKSELMGKIIEASDRIARAVVDAGIERGKQYVHEAAAAPGVSLGLRIASAGIFPG